MFVMILAFIVVTLILSYIGAVKLTPSHSLVDHELAEKHRLARMNVFNDDGTMCNCGEEFNVSSPFLIIYYKDEVKLFS